MIQQELNNISTYVVGDFIIKVIDAHNVRITTDRGTVLVCPRSDNSIIVKSSKALENESKDLKIYKEEPKWIANNTTLSDFKKISGMNGRIYNFCSQAGIKTFDDFMSFVPSTYCGNMTYRTIAEITELQYEYKGEWERASADNRDIDWEQRRYEIAKELMKGFASNPHDQCADASCETLAQWSISGADALITELKKEVNNDTEASI